MLRPGPLRAAPTVVALLALVAVGPVLAPPAPLTAQEDESSGDPTVDLPLEMEDTLALTLSEGSWISLDVTPDGEAVVFELLGDIWRVPLAGGTAEPVMTGPQWDSQPSLSPDGRWIAFISDRDGHDNLWIAEADGSEPRKLTSEGRVSAELISPTWTPDSRYVIATKSGRNGGLYMYHVDGGRGLKLEDADPPAGADDGPGNETSRIGADVSPDGRHLYFAQRGGGGELPAWQIARRDMETGLVDALTQSVYRAFRPVVSPDGTKLVYGTRYEAQTGLRVRDLETGADDWLLYPVQRDEMESGGLPSRDLFPGMAFTPDGSELVTTFGGGIWRVPMDGADPVRVPFTADVRLAVGPELANPYRVEQGPVRARLAQDPRLSPDGERIAVSVLTKLYTMELDPDDPDGGEPTRLTGSDEDVWEFKPAWSPDGLWIAYVTWDMDGGHIWKIRSDGSSDPVRLSEHPAFYTDLAWSPDGARIVGLRGNAFQRQQTFSEFGGLRIDLDLVRVDADGGEVTLVAPARGLGAPHFAQGAERVFVYSDDGLVSMRWDGTDRRVHLRVTGPSTGGPEPPAAQEVLMRPGGEWALASVGGQLHVVAVPPAGPEGTTVSTRGTSSVPSQQITDIGADYFAWSDDGEALTWAIGSTFYRRPFASLEFERPAPGEEEDEGEDDEEAEEEEEGAEEDEEQETPEARDEHEAVEAYPVAVERPRATPEGTVALTGATLITMNGDEVVEDGTIVVTDNRIVALGPSASVEIPAAAEVYDASGHWIVPGFVDTHAHWEFRTHDVLEPQNWSLVANLAYGVTAGLDVQTSTNDYFAYQDLVETGQSVGQRAFMTGPGIFSRSDFRSYEATYGYLRRYRDHYRTPNIKSYVVGTREQRQWVVRASEELGLMPTTEGARDMKLDLTHAVDGFHGNEHTLPLFPFYEDVVQLYARTRTAYTPTLLVQYGAPSARPFFLANEEVHDDEKLARFYPHNRIDEMTRRIGSWARDDEYGFAEAAAQAAKIQRAGGLVGVGGHGELQGLGYHWEMWALAAGGMTPREVLQAATVDGAEIIGIQQDLGSLEVGKLADLVVLRESPLDDIRHTNTIRWVMKNGELYEGDTLTRLWPTRRELRPFWWWDAGPETNPAFPEGTEMPTRGGGGG